MDLIYHKVASKNEISNFDRALLRVATNANPLRLASPYIGLTYLRRITELSSNWLLLTDIEAWLKSGNRKHRVTSWEFIANNLDKIKHVSDLHAKAAIGNGLLFLGSANFTNYGIQSRTELSVLIDETRTVAEGIKWFDELWRVATPPIIEEGDALVSALNKNYWMPPRPNVSLTSTAPKIQTALSDFSRPTNGLDIAGIVAKAAINEFEIALSLKEEYENCIEKFVTNKKEFKFYELLAALQNKYKTISSRQLLSLITVDTVNHLCGGFAQEGFDRFLYVENIFYPWNEHGLSKIQSMDLLLKFIIMNLKFEAPNKLPPDSEWLLQGLPAHKILSFIENLINFGLIVEVDNPGELESYYLDHTFVWPRRWIKFRQAYDLFKSKLNEYQTIKKINSHDENDDWYEPNIKTDRFQDSLYLKLTIKSEITKEAARQKITPKSLGALQDTILVKHFSKLKAKKTLTTIELNELIDDLKNQKFPKYFIKEFVRKNEGAFILIGLDRFSPSRTWDALTYLHFYSGALTIWQSFR